MKKIMTLLVMTILILSVQTGCATEESGAISKDVSTSDMVMLSKTGLEKPSDGKNELNSAIDSAVNIESFQFSHEVPTYNGVYILDSSRGRDCFIQYLDYESETLKYLCSLNDCKHEKADCECYYQDVMGLYFTGDVLYMLDTSFNIYEVDLESNKANQAIALGYENIISETLGFAGGELYYFEYINSWRTEDYQDTETESEDSYEIIDEISKSEVMLKKANLDTGEISIIFQKEYDTYIYHEILGGNESEVLFLTESEGLIEYFSIGLESKEIILLAKLESSGEIAKNINCGLSNGKSYVVSIDDSKLYIFDLLTKEMTSIELDFEQMLSQLYIPNQDDSMNRVNPVVYSLGVTNDYVLISSLEGTNNENTEFVAYAIDNISGKITAVNLKTNIKDYPIGIVNETEEDFLVVKGREEIPTTIIEPNGEEAESIRYQTIYAMISKEDYINSNAIYREIN